MDPGIILFNKLIVEPTNFGQDAVPREGALRPLLWQVRLRRSHLPDVCGMSSSGSNIKLNCGWKWQFFWLEGTNTLKVLDDLGAGQTRHFRESRWHQRVGSDVAAFQHREAFQKECGSRLSVLHASGKTTKGIFVEYTAKLNERKFSHLVSLLRHPFSLDLNK